jgi:purine nucleosidase
MEKVKVLLDTDIGTDIDDAVCLAYLLAHPRCDLLGITTVTGESEKRAMLASALCRRAGKDIPIFPGTKSPLLLPQRQNRAQQAAALARWSYQADFPRGEAVEFMRRTIRRHSGEVVLLTIAPLTNIGLLFSIDPEIPMLLKGLVMMCGRFLEPTPKGYGPAEWNAVVDAHATSIVYSAPVKSLRSIGLDVTSQVSMAPQEFHDTFREVPLFAPILEWAEIWFRDWPGTTFHDPLAAATIFEPTLCTYLGGRVTIDLTEGDSFGLTRWAPNADGSPHRIAETVDAPAFFRHYLSVVKGS